ncbi:hypothetical protein [Phycicoccus sp. DTK01]|uniref:hypothetical protein n=1 Tax=Phycicoccus sp. DTK01 TaxID=2785745 RepID=UPI001A8FFC3F|nr:hypothetical protein [Phycicoccus sp. DTK01]GIL36994.1 hypothetical protein PDTK01_30690 [Phycicoccus sp. DTK01]
MTTLSPGGRPTAYVLRVSGHLDPPWAAMFGMVLVHDPDGTTTLTGAVTDQAALHGTLARIRDLGVTLISVVAIDPGSTP